MPGERTLYRKIQVVLNYSKEEKHASRETLVSYILKHRPTNFLHYWRDRETDEVKHGYSETSINRAIQVCVNLRLLGEPEMHLTKKGANATDSRRFPLIVGDSVAQYLDQKSIPVPSLQNVIREILRADSPAAPTAPEIWRRLGEPEHLIDPTDFRQMMALLGQCNVLFMTQRRIYLPPHS